MKTSASLQSFSDQELHHQTLTLAQKERATTLALLEHLSEISRRKLYARRGFASLWEYTVKALGYSDSQACERIRAMEFMMRNSKAKEAVTEQRINLSQASMIERHLRSQEKEAPVTKQEVTALLDQVNGQSKRDTERVLVTQWPKAIVPESIKPKTQDQTEVRFIISESTRRDLERFKELKGSHSLSEIFAKCLASYLEKQDPKRRRRTGKKTESKSNSLISRDKITLPAKWKSRATQKRRLFAKAAQRSRYISRQTREIVHARSDHQCEYVDPVTQRRCESRYLLQVDHIKPYACGGSSDLNNLRMLCAMHNQFLAKEVFGKNLPFGKQH